jgi:hypothetical protein
MAVGAIEWVYNTKRCNWAQVALQEQRSAKRDGWRETRLRCGGNRRKGKKRRNEVRLQKSRLVDKNDEPGGFEICIDVCMCPYVFND